MKPYIIKAINVSDNVNLKNLKKVIPGKILASTISELFYKVDVDSFIAFYNYGVIVYTNIPSIEEYITEVQINSETILDEVTEEEIVLEFKKTDKVTFEENTLTVPEELYKPELLRIVMFDLSQTVAMDSYALIADNMLSEIKTFAKQLEEEGKLKISEKEMKKFLGRALNTKNMIVDNLYIFDSPDITWDDEEIDKVHKILVRSFDLNARFKEIEYTFNIIDDNLDIVKDLYQHGHSATLEWIVIILILFEILKSLYDKFSGSVG